MYNQDTLATKLIRLCQGPRVKVTKRQSVNTLMKCLKFDHGNLNSDMYVKRYAPGE